MSLAKQKCLIAFPNTEDKKDNLADWESSFVDTFSYVFFPSTGKALDAADKFHLFDPRIRETDGKVYLAGAEGISEVTLPANAYQVLKELKKRGYLD